MDPYSHFGKVTGDTPSPREQDRDVITLPICRPRGDNTLSFQAHPMVSFGRSDMGANEPVLVLRRDEASTKSVNKLLTMFLMGVTGAPDPRSGLAASDACVEGPSNETFAMRFTCAYFRSRCAARNTPGSIPRLRLPVAFYPRS